MQKYIIEGGASLSGSVSVSGSKNAALPVIFATLVTHGISKIYNLPDIEDVRVALLLIEGFGAVVTRECGATVIDTRKLTYSIPKEELVCRLRASTYLIGACLSRFGIAKTDGFGGCNFSHRPIDLHISAMRSLGAKEIDGGLVADRLRGGKIRFPIISVGATVNALIVAAATPGQSVIEGASREPHIDTLIEFLRGAGAEISVYCNTIYVVGRELSGSSVKIPGDMIEAGTFLAISALSCGKVCVKGVEVGELDSFISPFVNSGMRLERNNDGYYLTGSLNKPVDIVTAPFPGFPTDLQPICAPLLALNQGGSIRETVWQERFGYLCELNKMGLSYASFSSCTYIYKSRLCPAITTAPDLRGGAALVIAALFINGESTVENAEILNRGYEHFGEKLSDIGARIKKLENP